MLVKSIPFLASDIASSFLAAFEQLQFSVIITDANNGPNGHEFLYVNESFKQQTGYSEVDLAGQTPRILQGKGTDVKTLNTLKAKLEREEVFIGQAENYRKDGSAYIVRWSILPLVHNGDTVAYLSMQQELTDYLKVQEREYFLSQALNQSAQAAMITDPSGQIVYVNRALCAITGYEPSEILGKKPSMFKSGQMDANFYRKLWASLTSGQSFEGVFINRSKEGMVYHEHKVISPIFNEKGDIEFYLALSSDISERVRETMWLSYKANHDALTGLMNRNALQEKTVRAIQDFKQKGSTLSFVVADIDNFKPINDTFGHDKGDKVLKRVADLIKSAIRDTDAVGRWGGEEFCLLLHTDKAQAERIADMLRKKIEALEFKMLKKPLTMSFGVAEIKVEEDFDSLFKRADNALYEAKESGKNKVVSAP